MTARWINSLSGRLTLFIVLALVVAMAVGIGIFVNDNSRQRSLEVSEGFMRQFVGLTDLFNSTTALERAKYLETQTAPAINFWVGDEPSVKNAQPGMKADQPAAPSNWNAIDSGDKRLLWFPNLRPWYLRLAIVQAPQVRSGGDVRRPIPGLEDRGPPPDAAPNAWEQGPPNGPPPRPQGGPPGPPPDGGPPGFRGPPPGGPGGGPPGAPPAFAVGPDGEPLTREQMLAHGGDDDPRNARRPPQPTGRLTDFNHGPPPGGVPPNVRWRVAIQLKDGTWLNGEQMYELGLPPWLSTVLYQNGVILAIMLLMVVPVIAVSTRRVKELARAADSLGRGENTEPLPESGASELRQLTQAFNNMSLRLRRFVQGRTEMLAGISHDLRTPITALRLRADLVDDDENRERMQALITDMQHLTEATLTLARDESFTEKTDRVDISTLIEGICDDLTDAGIDATAEVERGVTLKCRPFSLRRAIRNLAENGAKYGKRARIHMNGDARTVRIMIDDEGPGIPEDQVEKAFLPFVRLEGSRSRETGGSGLGLAISRSIVLNHGGELKLQNRSEGGLRAVLTLPREYDA